MQFHISNMIRLFFVKFNQLFRSGKIEAFEDVILEQEQIIGDTASRVDTAMTRMKDIDRIGSF